MKLPPAAAGERLDRAIAAALSTEGPVSIAEVRAALKARTLLVDGRAAAPGARARGGESIDHAGFLPRHGSRVLPEVGPVPILFEDDELLALEKPSGMHTAPLRPGEAGTLLGVAVGLAPAIGSFGPPLEGGLVHRLDRGTSGVVIFAKRPEVRARLRAAFAAHAIEKRYLAITVAPEPAPLAGQAIDRPLSGEGAIVRLDPEGLPARSELARVEPLPRGLRVEVVTRTGRRHQVRVHLASIGAPIVGDETYGGPAAPRLLLHALGIALPGGPSVTSPPGPDFRWDEDADAP